MKEDRKVTATLRATRAMELRWRGVGYKQIANEVIYCSESGAAKRYGAA
jgi:hypothetical protein